ncbi:MAG: T9SS type A sorting domain-containing protein [Melioribacteraceae bacterium]
MKKFYNLAFICFVIVALFSINIHAQSDGEKSLSTVHNSIQNSKGGGKKLSSIQSINGQPSSTRFNINKISTWFKNNGESDIRINPNFGLIYPKGSYKTAIEHTGGFWGGKIDGEIRVGGCTEFPGTLPGRVINNVPVNPSDPDVRIYRVRRDYRNNTLLDEDEFTDDSSIEEVRQQYEKDWIEWPAIQGAPFEDLNANGSYEPELDIPGVPGADQTIWFVCNDFDSTQSKSMYGTLPLGIEEQVTIWGYNNTEVLGNMFFRKYLIINKNKDYKPFTDMYFAIWASPFIGNGGDDLVGCDTTLNLGFAYNANNIDEIYGNTPPALGFKLLQGPKILSTFSDSAKYKGKYFQGMKNLGISSFNSFIRGADSYGNPSRGSFEYGGYRVYNELRGYIAYTNDKKKDPYTEKPTPFSVPGDPVTSTGWIDGNPGDRSINMGSGPFNLTYGDTQEVVYAEILAGATVGVNRLNAITLLKEYSQFAQTHYLNNFYILIPPKPLLPNNKSIDISIYPLIKWSSVDNAINYSLDVATDSVFQNLIFSKNDITDTTYQLQELIYSTKYFWRVGVKNNYGSSYNSMVFSFSTFSDSFRPTLKVSPYTLTIDQFENVINFEVTNTSQGSMNWNAVSKDTSWIRIVEGVSGVNSGVVKVVFTENKKGERSGSITVTSADAAGSPRNITIKQCKAQYEVAVTLNPDSTATIYGNKKYNYGDSVSVIVKAKYGYTFSNWSENDSIVSTNSQYEFRIFGNKNLTANFYGPFCIITRISEMEGDRIISPHVGIETAGTNIGSNGYIVSNQAGGVNLPFSASDYDRFEYWKNDDVIIDFSEKSLAFSYLDENIYKNSATGEKTYLPFSVYRLKYPTMKKIRLFAGFRDKNGDGLFSIDSTGAYDINWHKPTTELIFAWQGYDAEGNEVNYDSANEVQYISNNDLYKSANITWGSSTGEFKYPYLTNTMFVLYTANATLPDSNRQIRFFTAKPIVSDVNEEEQYEKQNRIPVEYSLSQNYPNPFNPSTNIKFALTKTSIASLKVYDILGREVATLVNKELNPGNYNFQFNGSRLSSGIYFYRLQTGEFTQTKKMLLIK